MNYKGGNSIKREILLLDGLQEKVVLEVVLYML